MPSRVTATRQAIADHEKMTSEFNEDQITQTCGCADDFQVDFDKRLKRLLIDLEQAGLAEKDQKAINDAQAGYERWMP